MRRWLFSFAIGCSAAFAQHDHGPGEHVEKIGWVSAEILQRPVVLRSGIGSLHEPVTTSSTQAAAFYDQGLAYIHNYVWIEASRSFHQALRLDPKLAMAHIGLARTYWNMDDLDQARAHLAKAQALQAGITEREKMRIAVTASHLESLSAPKDKARFQAYRDLLDQSLARFPDDAELWLLRGNASEASPYGRGQRGAAQSIAFYEAALRRAPSHWGANHYLIHSYEMIGRVDQALEHGKIYVEAAPAIPHAHHMYGHDLRRNGQTGQAIARFLRAKELEDAYYREEKIDAGNDWHRNHNLNLLATSYQYQGRMKETEQLLLESRSLPIHQAYQEFNHKDYFEFLLHRARYNEALTAARQQANSGRFPIGRAAGHALAGNALLALNQIAEARQELQAAQKEVDSIGGDIYAQPYIEALRGEILLREKDPAGATLLKSVAADIRAVPGPDAWMQAIYRLELLARAARDAGDWELAEFMAGQMLAHDPRYGGTHFALALVAEHKGDVGAAKTHFAHAAAAWSKADAGMTETAEIKRRGIPPSTVSVVAPDATTGASALLNPSAATG
jgi:tetratricopeptide (TPR) repeat protein